MGREYAGRDQDEVFARLQGLLSGDGAAASYAEIAGASGMSEGALKVAVHRLHKRYGELIRAEIAQTVATPEGVDEELRHLFAVLRDEG